MDDSTEVRSTPAESPPNRKGLFSSDSWMENLLTLCRFILNMFAANILFILFSLPIITIPASKISLTKVMLKLYQLKPCPVWKVFWGEFKQHFLSKTIVGFILMLAPVSAALYVYLSSRDTFTVSIFVIFAAVSFLLESYWMTAVSYVDVPVWANLKNAVFLTFSCWKRSSTLLITAGLGSALLFLLLPYTLLLYIFCFALIQLIVCIIASDPIQKNLIREYADQSPPEANLE